MSRIIGGQGRGRRLVVPKGWCTRPTGSRVRQTLFDILAPVVSGCRFLDAFAGSGAVGLEALSRGAARVVLIDSDRVAVETVRANLERIQGSSGAARVFHQDARVALPALAEAGEVFDVIYVDPPYASDLYEKVLDLLASSQLLAASGVVVAEHFHKRPLPETIVSLVRQRQVRIGDHYLTFFGRTREGGE